MSLSWIQINPRLLEGINIVNSLKNDDVSYLLEQIELRENKISPEKGVELEKLFSLSKEDANLVIKTTQYIIKRMFQVMMKPTVLLEQLSGPLQLSNDKAKDFLRVWVRHTNNCFVNLEQKSELDNIIWELNLQTVSSSYLGQVIPTATVEFHLKDVIENTSETAIVTLNEKDLLQFSHSLEEIQNKIDSIKSSCN